MSTPARIEDARQAALAAEHRAVFGYALLGPRLTGADRARAAADEAAHEQVRDRTQVVIAAAGATPVSSRADYPELFPVPDAAAAIGLAVRLERDCARAWRYLYSAAVAAAGTDRAAAQANLTAAAVRAAGWRVRTSPAEATTPFPGI